MMSARAAVDGMRLRGVSRRGFVKQASMGAVLAGGLLPALTACSDQSEARSVGGAAVKMLSTSYGNVIPWTTQGYTSQRFWSERFNIKLTQLDPGADPGRQLDQLENALAQKWDVAVVNSIIQGNLTGAVQRLIDAGTVVVGYLSDVALEDKPIAGLLTTVQTDNYKIGFDLTTSLCKALGGQGTIIETQGIAGGTNVVQRHRGFQDALKDFPGIEVLASDYGNFVKDRAQNLWESYITKYPRIDGAFCHNDDMAFGAANALKAAGREGQTLLTGVDGTPVACQAVLDGTLHATARHSASQVYGWPAMIGALKFTEQLDGITVPAQVVVDSPVVDRNRAASIVFTQADTVNLQ